MPVLKNARHEAFAQALATGMTRDAAYAAAGYKPDRQNAFRLTTIDAVMTRVIELSDRAAQKAEWTAADRLSSLKRISEAAEKNDPRVSVSAIAEANRMQGTHAPTKSEITGKGGGPIATIDVTRLKGMTNEELEVLERALVQIGIAERDTGGEE